MRNVREVRTGADSGSHPYILTCSHPDIQVSRSFPLDRGGRLGADVVDDAIDATHLVDDPRGDSSEPIGRQARPGGGHPVAALDGSNRNRTLIGAFITHDPDTLNRKQDSKTLPEARVPPLVLDLGGNNGIGPAQEIQARTG